MLWYLLGYVNILLTSVSATDSDKVAEVFGDQQLVLFVTSLSFFVKTVSLQQWKDTYLLLASFSLVVSLFLLYILTLSRYLVYKTILGHDHKVAFQSNKTASRVCL